MAKTKRRKWFIRLMLLAVFAGVCGIAFIEFSHRAVERNASGKLFNSADNIQPATVGLVLGASETLASGRANPFFTRRVEAAAQLYKAGKVKYLIVSGDNSRKEYDEPTAMKYALIKLGVPASKIYMDYAGFRTWDSVVRCLKIFDQDNFIIVSQPFHNKRAVYIAEHFGCTVQALNARDVAGRTSTARERLARTKLFLDILIGKKPKYLGEKVVIGQKQEDINA